jgi:hypothetical protein
MILTLVYLILAGMGCLYIAGSFLLGQGDTGSDGGDGGGDAGDAAGHGHDAGDAGHGHDDGGAGDHGPGHAYAAWVRATSPLHSLLSPMVVAMLFAAVGGWGLLGQHGLGLGTASLAVALPLGLMTAVGVANLTARLAAGSQSAGDEIRMGEFFGAEAEVITPIPAGGIGEVAAMVGRQRYAGPAREIEGRAVGRGVLVTVLEKVGPTLMVTAGDTKEDSADE